jgi:hypothetical protein
MKNEYYVDGGVAFIKINARGETLYCKIDESDLEKMSQLRGTWYGNWSKFTKSYYVQMTHNKKTIMLHRFIMNAPEGFDVDHIHHDTLDNRKSELRIVTSAQNQQNQRIRNDNKSGEPGVQWCERKKKWRARVRINGKEVSGGYHNDKQDAIEAVRLLRAQLHPYSPT